MKIESPNPDLGSCWCLYTRRQVHLQSKYYSHWHHLRFVHFTYNELTSTMSGNLCPLFCKLFCALAGKPREEELNDERCARSLILPGLVEKPVWKRPVGGFRFVNMLSAWGVRGVERKPCQKHCPITGYRAHGTWGKMRVSGDDAEQVLWMSSRGPRRLREALIRVVQRNGNLRRSINK